ncbi:hypothetical protein BB560_006028, partial [Smittium megazygosporum]
MHTPLWRRDENNNQVCNACGGSPGCTGCPTLNQKLIKSGAVPSLDRRLRLKKTPGDVSCFNCKTTNTPLWRRDDNMNIICNACGLYFKFHKKHRPISMKKNIIKRRTRNSAQINNPPKTMNSPPPSPTPSLALEHNQTNYDRLFNYKHSHSQPQPQPQNQSQTQNQNQNQNQNQTQTRNRNHKRKPSHPSSSSPMNISSLCTAEPQPNNITNVQNNITSSSL